jgi:hypothetical protein
MGQDDNRTELEAAFTDHNFISIWKLQQRCWCIVELLLTSIGSWQQ